MEKYRWAVHLLPPPFSLPLLHHLRVLWPSRLPSRRHSFNLLNHGDGAAMMMTVTATGAAIVIGVMTVTGAAAATNVTNVLNVGGGEHGSIAVA